MKLIQGYRIAIEKLDTHNYICDLINVEFPVLSLYSDGRLNWLYLWADTDGQGKHRWVLFPTTRELLLDYLREQVSLEELLTSARQTYLLDKKETYKFRSTGIVERESSSRYLRKVTLDELSEYRPAVDSFFDPALTSDLDLAEQLAPASYEVPIDGTWFGRDFEAFFKSYEKLYALFYATKPRFVKTVSVRLSQLLRAPWTGGFSRVNLYSSLTEHVPAVHTLRVDRMRFASPGTIRFEALPTIGRSIHDATLAYLKEQEAIEAGVKENRAILRDGRLNKADLSQRSDDKIDLARGELDVLAGNGRDIAHRLGMSEEFSTLFEHAPNTVVFAKAVNSFVRQMRYIASLQADGMLDLDRDEL